MLPSQQQQQQQQQQQHGGKSQEHQEGECDFSSQSTLQTLVHASPPISRSASDLQPAAGPDDRASDATEPLDSRTAELLVGIINCEGTESPGPLELLPLSELMRCYEINTAGAVAVTQCFLPLLRESRGRIINVCSSAGVTAAPINGSYAASKMALVAVSDSLRVELYPFGISVSIIEPGAVDAAAWSPPHSSEPASSVSSSTHSLQLRPLNSLQPQLPQPLATPARGRARAEPQYQRPTPPFFSAERRRLSSFDSQPSRPNSPQLFHVHQRQLKELEERLLSQATCPLNQSSPYPSSTAQSVLRRRSTGGAHRAGPSQRNAFGLAVAIPSGDATTPCALQGPARIESTPTMPSPPPEAPPRYYRSWSSSSSSSASSSTAGVSP
ncbi:hypothetical protein DFJ73DRAFT_648007, partial [Zopfochytrium polystomum]